MVGKYWVIHSILKCWCQSLSNGSYKSRLEVVPCPEHKRFKNFSSSSWQKWTSLLIYCSFQLNWLRKWFQIPFEDKTRVQQSPQGKATTYQRYPLWAYHTQQNYWSSLIISLPGWLWTQYISHSMFDSSTCWSLVCVGWTSWSVPGVSLLGLVQ